MKVEVRCAECHDAWLVDERNVADATCPRCSPARAPLTGATKPTHGEGASLASGAIESSVRATASAPATAVLEPRLAPRTRAITPAAEDPQPEEIVCPRCKLHFTPRERQGKHPVRSRATVLVVEDLEYFCQVASDALSPRFEVRTARTSAEARTALAAGDIDLLVLDLTLDGSEGGRQLLEELRPKPCPILIYTAQDESEIYGESWEELVRLGADDIVIKGMNVADSLMRKAAILLGTSVDVEDAVR